jgi:RsiW-degrading membrane proteinase PrsW (M82 family)
MFCAGCGGRLEAGAAFCSSCGKSQLAESKHAVAPVQAPVATPNHTHARLHLIQSLENRLTRLAGTEKLEGFSLTEMFSEVFKKRSHEELDDYFVTGTARTTPRIEDVQTGWPRPWFFFRVLVFLIGMYLGFDYWIQEFSNPNAIPGLLVMGSLAVPLTVLVLFFERVKK